ncbi:hypothetical protein GCM10010246_61910 [Streptomyces cuspidosporus]|uniref:Secreted protein n=1 Tax=Streptomyces cuspidosporus TaxID=66882 RepID=A0ABN3GVK2_9ACTN
MRTTFAVPLLGAAGAEGEGEGLPEDEGSRPGPVFAGPEVLGRRPKEGAVAPSSDEQPATSSNAAAEASTGVTPGRRTFGSSPWAHVPRHGTVSYTPLLRHRFP